MPSPLKLPAPTICDMNCYFRPGHDGRHQFESQDAYEKRTMKQEPEKLILVQTSSKGYWSEWQRSFEDVVETQQENFSDHKVNGNPAEIIEVRIVRRATVQAQVITTYE